MHKILLMMKKKILVRRQKKDDIDFNVCRLGLAEDNSIYSVEPLRDIICDIHHKRLKIVKQRPEEEAKRTLVRLEKYKDYGYRLKRVF